ncbi:22071_t:CDS:1, partial [Gigaspora rosea]
HWNIEGNNITEKCVGCIEHIATRTTAGTMMKLIKDVTPLTENHKRRIYGNIADIIMAFRRRKKQEERFAKEIFMSKSTIRSWRFIKNFRNMDKVLMKKHEEIGNKKE